MSQLPPLIPHDQYANDFRVFAEWDWSSLLFDIRLLHYHGMGGRTVSIGKPIEMVPVDRERHSPPTLSLKSEAAQSLMDSLWHAGLRPTEGTGSAGALAATQRHLDDMRALVFNKPLLTKEPVVK
jgi:hypothetical protein